MTHWSIQFVYTISCYEPINMKYFHDCLRSRKKNKMIYKLNENMNKQATFPKLFHYKHDKVSFA